LLFPHFSSFLFVREALRFEEDKRTMSDPRYPIGKYAYDGPLSPEQRTKLIDDIAHAPDALRAAVKGLSPQQIETPYRDGGWTVRQVTHHVPESHMNAYIRFKLALTEDSPTIKPYMEDRWARLADVESTPMEVSLTLLDSLHQRWVHLLRSLQAQDWKRTFTHPEMGSVSLEKSLALYSWHGRHHVAHITELRKKMGW
jgi:DinB superfamily